MRKIAMMVALLGYAAGCSKSKKTSDAKPPAAAKPTDPAKLADPGLAPVAPVTVAAKASDAPACPSGDALKARLTELFKIEKDGIEQEPSCAAGHYPAPGWAVEVWFHQQNADGDSITNDRFAILDATGKVVSSTDDEIPPGAVDSSGVGSMQAVDFDGDGTDEVLSVFGSDKHGFESHNLNVQRLAGGKWVSAMSKQFQFDNSAAGEDAAKPVSCESKWEVTPPGADHTRSIIFTPTGKAPKSDECIAKKETWAFAKDGKLAKIN